MDMCVRVCVCVYECVCHKDDHQNANGSCLRVLGFQVTFTLFH